MADKITTSNVLNVGVEWTTSDDEKITTKISVPDCKHGLTETVIKNRIFYSIFGQYKPTNENITLTRDNVYTADETATEKIEIDLE